MGRRLRIIETGKVYAIGNRTIESRHWLKGCKDVNKLVGVWLARAVKKYKFVVHDFVAMDNHYHGQFSEPHGGDLSSGIGYFESNLSKSINRLYGRKGPLWQRRFDSFEVLTPDDQEQRMAYHLLNPVKARMSKTPKSSPCFSAARYILGDNPFECTYLHKRIEKGRLIQETKHLSLRFAPLPHMADWLPKERRCHIKKVLSEHPSNAPKTKLQSRDFSVGTKPKRTKVAIRPRCLTRCAEAKKAFIKRCHFLEAMYRDAMRRFRQQLDEVLKIPGCMKPPSNLTRLEPIEVCASPPVAA